ncbi:photoreceptor cilium actin regulator [Brienomyrus brachyistius]|uniref:photoreceptor cilium actin regulator n=1 Tax=Brienomyrus brachyistius TaxID=42636 RepID=UPI0020B3BA58|nr:photoreceptor cilium actin regulator [Brienomyrus brachyistius]
MGCSPSKGHSFTGVQNTLKKGGVLLPASKEKNEASRLDDGESALNPGAADDKILERAAGKGGVKEEVGKTNRAAQLPLKSTSQRPSSYTETGSVSGKLYTQEIKTEVKETQGDGMEERIGKKARQKARKVNKQVSKKAKEKKAIKEKVDFPEPLVNAHHAAYAYLNPSIAKYEVLLGLLDQALQTRLSLQPMVSFMALRYEEVNSTLAQIADEGESILMENGEYLSWPCPLKNHTDKTKDLTTEQPPDLLQQLLQYTTQRMRLVSHSLGRIADSALEDAVEYFASVSELLDEKLKVRRAVEARLAQVLTRIELAALHKPSPDDSTLYSEDSGIGPESWSLMGSERRRESLESAGVGSNISDTPLKRWGSSCRQMRRMSTSMSLNSTDSSCTITAKEQRDNKSLLGLASMDDADGEEDEDDNEEEKKGYANRSTSDQCHLPRRLPTKRIENPQNVEMTLKMKDAISGRIHLVPKQGPTSKVKQASSSGNERSHWMEEKQKLKRSRSAAHGATSMEMKKKDSVTTQRRSRSSESPRSKAEDPTPSQCLGRMNMAGSREDDRGRSIKRRGAGKLPGTHSTVSSRQCSSLPRNLSACTSQEKLRPRQNSLGEKEVGTHEDDKEKEEKSGKGPLRAAPPPSTPPSMAEPSPSLNTGTSSVKRLIDAFSQGLEEKHLIGSTLLGPLRAVRKCGIPIIPGLGNREVILDDSINSRQVDSNNSNRLEDVDIDNLPPPPPEVLMDNSFEVAQESQSNDGKDGSGSMGCSPALQRTTVSQRLRAFTQSVTVLPSRRRIIPKVSPVQQVSQNTTAGPQTCKSGTVSQDLKSDKVTSVYEQVQKIIHIQHSSESSTENCQADTGHRKPLLTTDGIEGKRGRGNPVDTVPSTPAANSQQPATVPISRARILPSPPPKPHSQHRRLPSPPLFKRQTAPPYSCSPPSSRKLPTPPLKPRGVPSTPQVNKAATFQRTTSPLLSRREITQNPSDTPNAFKTPSPPVSPRVQRFSRDTSGGETSPLPASILQLSGNAHSVFCPASSSLFQAQPWSTSCTPQAWTPAGGSMLKKSSVEPSRAMLPVLVRGPRSVIRRSQSDRRLSLTLPTWTPTLSIAHSCGSEPAINIHGFIQDTYRCTVRTVFAHYCLFPCLISAVHFSNRLEDGHNWEAEAWGSQSDVWAINRSVSHPDLCIVGRALHRE